MGNDELDESLQHHPDDGFLSNFDDSEDLENQQTEEFAAESYQRTVTALAGVIASELGTLYRSAEEKTFDRVTRRHLVSIEDTCLETLLAEEWQRKPQNERVDSMGNPMDKDDYIEGPGMERAYELIAQALLEGKNVTYLPVDGVSGAVKGDLRFMRLPDISRLPSVSAVRFDAAHDYAETHASPVEQDEAERMERLLDNASVLRSLNYFDIQNNRSPFSRVTKNTYFAGWEQEHGQKIETIHTNAVRTIDRAAASSLAVAAMVCEGCAFEDIFDPEKLHGVKDRIGRETAQHLLDNDYEWVARTNLRARQLMSEDVERRMKNMDFSDMQSLFTEENRLAHLEAMTVFDLSQDYNKKEVSLAGEAWFEENRGTKTAAEFKSAYDRQAVNLESMLGSIFTGQRNSLLAASGLRSLRPYDAVNSSYICTMLDDRRWKQPDAPLSDFAATQDLVMMGAFDMLGTTAPELSRDLKRQMREDPRTFARKATTGTLLEDYTLSVARNDDNLLLPYADPHPKAVFSDPAALHQNSETIPEAGEAAENEEADFADRMEALDFDNLTAADKRAEISEINKDLIAAGLTPMTDAEMDALASDPEPEKQFRMCRETAEQFAKIEHLQQHNTYTVSPILQRSIGYQFGLGEDTETLERNEAIAAELRTEAGVGRVVRSVYDRMKNTDPASMYTDSLYEKIQIFKDHPQEMLQLFESDQILAKGGAKYLSPEEYREAQELRGLFQSTSTYMNAIKCHASPLSMFLPKLNADDAAMLMVYYTQTNQPEKLDYIQNYVNQLTDEVGDSYSNIIAERLKKEGFLEKSAPGVSYETYNAKGELLTGRNAGISELSTGSSETVRFVRTTKNRDGSETKQELRLDRSEFIRQDARAHLDESLGKVLPAGEKPVFSTDPLLRDAQKAVLLNALRTDGAYNHAPKEEDRVLQYRQIADSVLSGNDPMLRFLEKQPRRAADTMISMLSCEDSKYREPFFHLYSGYSVARGKNETAHDPAGDTFRGMFLPKTDSSKMQQLFSGGIGTGYASSERIRSARGLAEAIELPVPEGWNENDVSAVVMSCLMTKDRMERFYRDAMNMQTNGSTLKDIGNLADNGLACLFNNTLTGDQRENMHLAETYLPGVREEALIRIGQFQSGDYRELAEGLKACFDFNLPGRLALTGADDAKALAQTKVITSLYDALQKPEFREYVTFTEEEKDQVEMLRTEMKIVSEMTELQEAISAAVTQKQVGKTLLGESPDVTSPVSEDAGLREMFLECQARRLYLERCTNSVQMFRSAAGAKYGMLSDDYNEAMRHRPVFRCQKNMMNAPEEYLGFLKKEILESSSKEVRGLLDAPNWDEAQKAVDYVHKLTDGLSSSYSIMYNEKWVLSDAIDKAAEMLPDDEFRGMKAQLAAFPCKTDPEELTELSAQEMERRAAVYEKAYGDLMKIRDTLEEPEELLDDEAPNAEEILKRQAESPWTVVGNLADTFRREASALRTASVLAETERSYERSYIEKHRAPEKILSEDEIRQRLEEQKAALDTAAERYGALPFDRMTRGMSRDMIKDLLTENQEITRGEQQFEQVITDIHLLFDDPDDSVRFTEVTELLGSMQDRMNEQMLDDDSPELLEKFSFVSNLINRLELYKESSEPIPEAADENSPFRQAYANAKERAAEIGRLAEGIDREKYPQFGALAEMAAERMGHIRDAIADEAFGMTDSGLRSLRSSDDLAVLTVFTVAANVPAENPLRQLLEAKGAETYVYRADNSELLQGQKAKLTADVLGRALASPQGFKDFAIENRAPAQSLRVNNRVYTKEEIQNGPRTMH